jgi:hypothetical protein
MKRGLQAFVMRVGMGVFVLCVSAQATYLAPGFGYSYEPNEPVSTMGFYDSDISFSYIMENDEKFRRFVAPDEGNVSFYLGKGKSQPYNSSTFNTNDFFFDLYDRRDNNISFQFVNIGRELSCGNGGLLKLKLLDVGPFIKDGGYDSLAKIKFTSHPKESGGQGAPVPEPSTFVLLGSGLLGLFYCGRKRGRE